MSYAGKRIAYPKIGAGLAKGDWAVIEAIISEELEGEDHTLVCLGGVVGWWISLLLKNCESSLVWR